MKNTLSFALFLIFNFYHVCVSMQPTFQKEIVSSDQYCYEASIKAYDSSQHNVSIGHVDYGVNLQSGYANIATLYVGPRFRRNGIASKLIRIALEEIQEHCPLVKAVTLQAHPDSPDMALDQLIAFYKKCGAECEGFKEINGIRFAMMRFKYNGANYKNS